MKHTKNVEGTINGQRPIRFSKFTLLAYHDLLAIISSIAFFKSPIADPKACPFSDRNLKPRHRVGVFARGLRIGFFPLSKVLHNAAAQVRTIGFIKIGMEHVPHVRITKR